MSEDDIAVLPLEIVQNASGFCEVVRRSSEPWAYRRYARFYGSEKDQNAELFIAAMSAAFAPVSKGAECWDCKGVGYHTYDDSDDTSVTKRCPTCDGTGKVKAAP